MNRKASDAYYPFLGLLVTGVRHFSLINLAVILNPPLLVGLSVRHQSDFQSEGVGRLNLIMASKIQDLPQYLNRKASDACYPFLGLLVTGVRHSSLINLAVILNPPLLVGLSVRHHDSIISSNA